MSTVPQMTCRELVEVCTDFLDGALPAVDHDRLEEHLRDCPFCVEYLQQLRTTLALTGRLREDDVSDAMRGELLAVFDRWRGEMG